MARFDAGAWVGGPWRRDAHAGRHGGRAKIVLLAHEAELARVHGVGAEADTEGVERHVAARVGLDDGLERPVEQRFWIDHRSPFWAKLTTWARQGERGGIWPEQPFAFPASDQAVSDVPELALRFWVLA